MCLFKTTRGYVERPLDEPARYHSHFTAHDRGIRGVARIPRDYGYGIERDLYRSSSRVRSIPERRTIGYVPKTSRRSIREADYVRRSVPSFEQRRRVTVIRQ